MIIKNLGFKFLFVIMLVVLALLALYPPEKKLKPGIDLAGGHSLLYEIDTAGLTSAQQSNLAAEVIKQLRKRVDPNNQRNLLWRPIGNTRIEIQMPSATGAARELREAKDAAIDHMMQLNLSRIDIDLVLEKPADARLEGLKVLNRGVQDRIQELRAGAAAGGEPSEGEDGKETVDQRIRKLEDLIKKRIALFEELAKDYESMRQIQIGEVAGDEVTATKKYRASRDTLLATSMSRNRMEDVLGLDAGPGRDEQLNKLRERHPAFTSDLDEVLVKYDLWSGNRGSLEDPEDLKRLLRGAGVLEFRILARKDSVNNSRLEARNPAYQELVADYVEPLKERGPRYQPGKRYRWFVIQDPVGYLNVDSEEDLDSTYPNRREVIEKYADLYYVLAYAEPNYGLLAGTDQKWKLVSAFSTRDFNTGRLVVNFQLDPRGGDLFGRLTGENLQWQLGIFLDDECMSAPNIDSQIHQSGVILGNFSQEDINYLVNTLKAGSLPARLKEPPLAERSIGSSLGESNRRQGFYAAVIGLTAVAAFVAVYYLLCGLIANVALALNILFVLGAMSVLEATFTLPGIAALILTVGMAVDANVLIFERIREEKRRGSSIKMAVKNGYEKAFSTILDANITTLITCVILGYAGSEEIKGFAIVLGLGVVFSMFTALFVTRIIFAALIQSGIVKSLPMLQIIGVPNVQWLDLRRYFWPVSVVMVACGAGLFFHEHSQHKSNIYDIEFLGGTAVTIQLKDGVSMTDEDVRERITGGGAKSPSPETAAGWLRYSSAQLLDCKVRTTSETGVFELSSANLSSTQLQSLVMSQMSDDVEAAARHGIEVVASNSIRVTTKLDKKIDEAKFRERLEDCATYVEAAATKLSNARVVAAWETAAQRDEAPTSFDISTTETNKELVRQSILAALGDNLRVQQPIRYTLRTDPVRAPDGYYAIHSETKKQSELTLGDVLGTQTLADVQGYQGGVAIVFDDLQPPQTSDELHERLQSARLLPEFEKFGHRRFKIAGLKSLTEDDGKSAKQRRLTSFALLVADENLIYGDDPGVWESGVAKPELDQAEAALRSQKTLHRVTQFAPQIASQTTQRALMAILLALIAIVIYIWIRFGNMSFGLAAIVALVHDVTISLGAVAASYYLADTAFGRALQISDFKIDLPMIAALLTIVGYSLNDTIVLFDRVRENRGKLKEVTAEIINPSINQTLSRTILTSVTTLLAVGVMYFAGGEGIHGFSFAMIIGVLVGTYSSVAIATPLILHPVLLKWVINFIVTLILVGLALMLDQPEMQVLVWILLGLFLLIVAITELRRRRAAKPALTARRA